MEQLIFIALIVFFSIIESIARKRKKPGLGSPELPDAREPVEDESPHSEWRTRAEGDAGAGRRSVERTVPRPRRPTGDEAWNSPIPTYDAERSYDDEVADEVPRGGPQPTSSEGMVPADLWKELEKLGRGRAAQIPEAKPVPKPAPRPAPKSAPRPGPKPAPRPHTPVPRPSPVLPPIHRRAAGHSIHRSHEGFGTDPSERAPSEQDRIDPFARTLSADAAAVHRQLKGHDPHALRQAMILQEILGPPVALRPDPFSEE